MYNDQKIATDRIGKKLEVKCDCNYCSPEEIIDCEFGHICTSDCEHTRDCPCQHDHFCSNSAEHTIEDCEGICTVHGRDAKEEGRGEMLMELERGN